MDCKSENCPILPLATMSASDRIQQRKAKAIELAKREFTQTEIAALLGVSQSTIRDYLSDLVVGTNLKRAKTAANPKGAGRPRGKRRTAPTADVSQKMAQAVLDEGRTLEQVTRDFDLPSVQHAKLAVAEERGRRQAEPIITPEMLSLSAQEKLAAAMRQHQRKLDAGYDQRVREAVRAGIHDALETTVLPFYEEKLALYEQVIKVRKGFMKKADYNRIRFCLHPDQYMNRTPEQRNAASQLWEELEVVLLSETEKPTSTFNVPKTYAELLARKQAAQEKRKTKRTSGRSSLAASELNG